MPTPCQTDETLFHSTTLDTNSQAQMRAYRRPPLYTPSGIADRIVFTEKLREALACRSRSVPSFALLFVHIRSVTLCSEACGFPTYHHIIDTVAAKLRRGLRTADMLIPCGKQGFVVFLAKASTASANAVATRLTTVIDNADFFYESVAFQIQLHVTVASLQADDTVDTILDRANHFLLARQNEDGLLHL